MDGRTLPHLYAFDPQTGASIHHDSGAATIRGDGTFTRVTYLRAVHPDGTEDPVLYTDDGYYRTAEAGYEFGDDADFGPTCWCGTGVLVGDRLTLTRELGATYTYRRR